MVPDDMAEVPLLAVLEGVAAQMPVPSLPAVAVELPPRLAVNVLENARRVKAVDDHAAPLLGLVYAALAGEVVHDSSRL